LESSHPLASRITGESKGCVKTSSIFLVLSLCLAHSANAGDVSLGSDQSLGIGVSYLHLRKSFLDFPMVWTSTMPVITVDYVLTTGKFHHRIVFDYARSTYININDSRRWGRNSFRLLSFQYDLVWYGAAPSEGKKFCWGLGASLENMEIDQATEVSPGKHSRHADQLLGIGPTLDLLMRMGSGQLGLDLTTLISIPGASYGILRSDAGFTDKCCLWWFDLKTGLHYAGALSNRLDLLVKFERSIRVYGRTKDIMLREDNFSSGGSILCRFLHIGLRYNF
jgi:hypothetical protein